MTQPKFKRGDTVFSKNGTQHIVTYMRIQEYPQGICYLYTVSDTNEEFDERELFYENPCSPKIDPVTVPTDIQKKRLEVRNEIIRDLQKKVKEGKSKNNKLMLQAKTAYHFWQGFQCKVKFYYQENKRLRKKNKQLRKLLKPSDQVIKEVLNTSDQGLKELLKSYDQYLREKLLTEKNIPTHEEEKYRNLVVILQDVKNEKARITHALNEAKEKNKKLHERCNQLSSDIDRLTKENEKLQKESDERKSNF